MASAIKENMIQRGKAGEVGDNLAIMAWYPDY
jgi:hypothetical protein